MRVVLVACGLLVASTGCRQILGLHDLPVVDAAESGDDDAPVVTIDAPDMDAPTAIDATSIDAPPSDLIAYYPMDSQPPGTDASGNGHTPTCTMCPQLGPGKISNGYRFNGNTDVMAIADASTLRPAMFTIAVWVQFQNLPSGAGTESCPVNKPFGPGNQDSWHVCLENAGGATYEWLYATASSAGTDTLLAAGTNISVNQWIHVAMTYDGTVKQLFLNGALAGTRTPTTNPIVYDTNAITLGEDMNNGAGALKFNGFLDDLRIYNKVLTTAEIGALPGSP